MRDIKIKSLSGCEYAGFYFIFAVGDDGSLMMNKFNLKEQKWGDWTKELPK